MMLVKKKKAVKHSNQTPKEEPLKIDKTFDEAIKATMFAADKKVKKSA